MGESGKDAKRESARIATRRAVHRFIFDRRFVFIVIFFVKTHGFFRKVKRRPYPCPGLHLAVRQRIVEETVPQFLRAQPRVDQLQEIIEPRRHRHHLGQRGGRVHPVEQGKRQLAVLPRIGRHPILAHPACLFAPDRRRHQIIGDDPPRDNQRRLPPQVKGIAARLPPQ